MKIIFVFIVSTIFFQNGFSMENAQQEKIISAHIIESDEIKNFLPLKEYTKKTVILIAHLNLEELVQQIGSAYQKKAEKNLSILNKENLANLSLNIARKLAFYGSSALLLSYLSNETFLGCLAWTPQTYKLCTWLYSSFKNGSFKHAVEQGDIPSLMQEIFPWHIWSVCLTLALADDNKFISHLISIDLPNTHSKLILGHFCHLVWQELRSFHSTKSNNLVHQLIHDGFPLLSFYEYQHDLEFNAKLKSIDNGCMWISWHHPCEDALFITSSPFDTESCPICFANFNEKYQTVAEQECGHVFHEQCLREWFKESQKNQCPQCKRNIQVVFIFDGLKK
ncbi:MAG: E3 ubiquitin protein ligase [Myxococcales bacterium]|nr:E3 ubiquitin protein ligase [Myxococcales bacterium]USN51191.1 MAG: E3 ubiquitin protein ligase [Myxococcales bacterium]